METELDEWELVSADGDSSQLTRSTPAEVWRPCWRGCGCLSLRGKRAGSLA